MTHPVIPSKPENIALAERVFDRIMEGIEPELMLASVATLDEKYAGETSEEHETRMQRYAGAYALFDRELEKFMGDINHSVHTNKRNALKDKEEQTKTEEQKVLNSLASAFA